MEQVTPDAGAAEHHATEIPPAARSSASRGYADAGHGHPPDPGQGRRGGGSRYRGSRIAGQSRARTPAHQDNPAPGAADLTHDIQPRPVETYPPPGGYPDAVPAGYPDLAAGGYPDLAAGGYPAQAQAYPGAPAVGSGHAETDDYAGRADRTEGLISSGRRHARRGTRRWRLIAIVTGAVAAAGALIAVALPGGGGSWPASVAAVQNEITIACQNPNVVSEPSQVNFACAKGTRQILWVFSLLTSDDNPDYSDPSNGRRGLEPIQPAQGGNIAWSLNLHHPYNPASPVDSLEVAARAINNIIGGATVTGSNGRPVVQAGLESTAANCATYTGSPALITRQGFPSVCALPVSSPAGQAALATDVFKKWMIGAPSQFAIEAGVLFQNADNPGDPRVQSILTTLRSSGL